MIFKLRVTWRFDGLRVRLQEEITSQEILDNPEKRSNTNLDLTDSSWIDPPISRTQNSSGVSSSLVPGSSAVVWSSELKTFFIEVSTTLWISAVPWTIRTSPDIDSWSPFDPLPDLTWTRRVRVASPGSYSAGRTDKLWKLKDDGTWMKNAFLNNFFKI